MPRPKCYSFTLFDFSTPTAFTWYSILCILEFPGNENEIEKLNLEIKPISSQSNELVKDLQKLNIEFDQINKDEERINLEIEKLKKDIKLTYDDINREKEIIANSTNNEERLIRERDEILEIEKNYYEIEKKATDDYKSSLSKLNKTRESLKTFFHKLINIIKTKEDAKEEDLSTEFEKNLSDIEDGQEKYASRFGKYDLVKQEAIKRKERLSNIDKEVKNWRDLKDNSSNKLEELKDKLKMLENNLETENDRPRQIAEKRGSYQQNIKNIEEDIKNINSNLISKQNKIDELNADLKSINEKKLEKTESKVRYQTIIENLRSKVKDFQKRSLMELNLNLKSIPEFSKIENLNKMKLEEAYSHLEVLKKNII